MLPGPLRRGLLPDARLCPVDRRREPALHRASELEKVTGERNGWNIAAHEAEEKLGEALTESRAEVRRLREAGERVRAVVTRIDDCGMAEPDQRVRMCRLHSDLRAAVEGLK